jgi:predicted amidohydrolase
MQEQLKIALLQSDLVWENPEKNRNNFSEKIKRIPDDVDLIILQELFSTGFTMNVKDIAETMTGSTVNWMLQNAKEKNSLLLGSVIIKEGNCYYNRFVIAFPNGKTQYYDKRHLFSFAGEEKVFTAGESRIVFNYKGFKICPLICYDLRFPVWSRNTEEIDLLIYVANWPNARMMAWDTLLKARAIENLCYVIGVNRVGEDNNKLIYTGHSTVVDTMGKTLVRFEENKENVKFTVLNKSHISETRSQFRFLDDKDSFEIKFN